MTFGLPDVVECRHCSRLHVVCASRETADLRKSALRTRSAMRIPRVSVPLIYAIPALSLCRYGVVGLTGHTNKGFGWGYGAASALAHRTPAKDLTKKKNLSSANFKKAT